MMMRIVLIFGLLFMLLGCSDLLPSIKPFPVLRTLPVIVEGSEVVFEAEIVQEGDAVLDTFGFVWDLENPVIDPGVWTIHEITNGQTIGKYSARIDKHLLGGRSYQVRAFGVLGDRRVYSNIVEFEPRESSEFSTWSFIIPENNPLDGDLKPFFSAGDEKAYLLYEDGRYFEFDPNTQAYTRGPDFLDPSSSYIMAEVGSILYVIANGTGRVSLYKLESGAWSRLGDLPFRLEGNDHRLMFESNGNLHYVSRTTNYRYDAFFGNWTRKPRLARNLITFVGGSVLDEKSYFVTDVKDMWEYNTAADSWTFFDTFYPSTIQDRIVGFSHEGRLFFGMTYRTRSFNNEETFDRSFRSFDPILRQWRFEAKFPKSLEAGELYHFYLDGKFYVTSMDPDSNNGLWVYTP